MKLFYSFGSIIFLTFTAISQNIGIGTTTPASKLSINGNLSIGANYLNTPAPANGMLVEGKVGIGTTTPTGMLHVKTTNSDTCLILNNTTNNGYAAKLLGRADIQGAIINNSSNFGGSVAVNDGLTVGDVQIGTVCYTDTPATCSFLYWYSLFHDFYGTPNFIAFWNIVPGYAPLGEINEVFNPTCNKGDCRSITKFRHTSSFFEYSGGGIFGIYVNIVVNNQLIKSISVASAVGTDIWNNDTIRVFVDSTNVFNGQDPDMPWVLYMYGTDVLGDPDLCTDFLGEIFYNYGRNIASGAFALYGEVRASGALYANSFNRYGDVAEFMDIKPTFDRSPEPGDLVSIDPRSAQSFILSSKPNDPLLIGAISEKPSVYINSPEEGMPVALTGRVKVKVNTEGGIIRPGDMITSSSVPGVGMKLTGDGTFIGYALEAFDGSRTNIGKIWILLAPRTNLVSHHSVKIVEGMDDRLGGVELRGIKRVSDNEKEVFIAWDKSLAGRIKDDVDFDDLVIDLNPFGGNAQLVVKEVNAEGFTVSIPKKTSSFKGFYYVVNIVSPSLYTEETESMSAAVAPSVSDKDKKLTQEARNIFRELQRKTDILIKKSGRDFSNIRHLKPEEMTAEKLAVAESWKNADPKVFKERHALAVKLDEMLRTHPHIRLFD